MLWLAGKTSTYGLQVFIYLITNNDVMICLQPNIVTLLVMKDPYCVQQRRLEREYEHIERKDGMFV